MGSTRGQAEEFFSKAGRKIDNLFSELRKSDISDKLELEKRLQELRRNKESLEKDFHDFNKENKEVFQDIANSFEETFEDIRKIFQKKENQKG